MLENHDYYIKVGRLDDLRRAGYLKISLKGRKIMIVFSDSGLVAMDLDYALDHSKHAASPRGLHDLDSDRLNILTGSFNKEWGKLTIYPVKIDGSDILISANPLN